MLEIVATSKLDARFKKENIYSYYAGFSEEFVHSLIQYLGVGKSDLVLDPWNGSGTTTSVCSRNGVPSIGIDINPFMKIVAAARVASKESVSETCSGIAEILPSFKGTNLEPISPHKFGAQFARFAFSKSGTLNKDVSHLIIANAVKQIYRLAQTRNPTWFSQAKMSKTTVTWAYLENCIRSEVNKMSERANINDGVVVSKRPSLMTADFLNVDVQSGVTHVIGSPPYLTRIDYVKKTLPELLYIKEFLDVDLHLLRRSMTGSVLTGGSGSADSRQFRFTSDTASKCLQAISSHSSKASKGYYHRFYAAYLRSMERSIQKICLLKIPNVAVVTQGSFYKEIYIDLPCIIAEMFAGYGYEEAGRLGFRTSHTMATINKTTFASAQRAPEEVVSIFGMAK